MHPFSDISTVESALQVLIDNKPAPLVKRIPAGGGRRVETFVHLLCGEVNIDDLAESPVAAAASPGAVSKAAPGRIEELEGEVSELKRTVSDLKEEIEAIKRELGL